MEGYLEQILVPLGGLSLVAYHLWFLYQLIKHPTKTVMGINAVNRRMWVETIMEDQSKNGILAVQTSRNNIMASTMLATMAITLGSIISDLITRGWGVSIPQSTSGSTNVVDGSNDVIVNIKFFSILTCFLLAFLFNVQAIRYYSHGGMLINVPTTKWTESSRPKAMEYIVRAFERASYFWSLGLRAFYFAFPLFMWIFGPIPMFVCCLTMVVVLYFLDLSFDDELTSTSSSMVAVNQC